MKVERKELIERAGQEYWCSSRRKHREQARVGARGKMPYSKIPGLEVFCLLEYRSSSCGSDNYEKFSSSNIPKLLTTKTQVGVLRDWRIAVSVYSSGKTIGWHF